LVLTAHVAGQETRPAESPLAPEQTAELQRARTIITDGQASPEVRRIGAEDLLHLPYPAATDLVIEFLRADDLLSRIALCEAVAVVGAQKPELLNDRLVSPLLELLGAADSELRSKAGLALASFRDGGVAAKLGDLAADPQAAIAPRLAAVDALAPNVDQRRVIGQLIRLLDCESTELRARVTTALRPASREDYGTDPQAWKRWWAGKGELDEMQWLLDRVRLFRQQNTELREAIGDLGARASQRTETLSERLIEQLRATYRLTPQPQKEELLIQWLQDPLLEHRSVAVSVIAINISDGHQPSEAARTTLRARFDDESAELRRAVFDVTAALTDPADAEAVCARLPEESDPVVREAILRTLGRLQNPVAIKVLIAELVNPNTSQGCLAEAANSLGLLGASGQVDPTVIAPAIGPLKERFATAPVEALRLRAALLGAMASMGASDFAEEIAANLEADEPDLLLAALQGVRALGDGVHIDRVQSLVAHNDPRVRRRAIEALAVLGGDATRLEALVSRLNPALESNEGVRQAAWNGFCTILSEATPATRLQWADRLVGFPELAARYLADLVAALSEENPAPAELHEARLRLANLYDSQGRYAEALPLWRDLWPVLSEAGDAQAPEVGLSLLRATLEAHRYDKLDELLVRLAADQEAVACEAIAGVVLEHIEASLAEPEAEGMDRLLDSLDRLPAGVLDPAFDEAVDQARERLAPPTASAPAEGQ
jgi:HEAT repeat protein